MELSILNTDILQVPADLIVLKYADRFYGADKVVADAIDFQSHIEAGEAVFRIAQNGVAARLVLFIGVGPLREFRYQLIQEFGGRAIKLAQGHQSDIRALALTIHGPGYGLDPEQAFLSMIAGIVAELKDGKGVLERVTIVEHSERRCALLREILNERHEEFGLQRSKCPATVTFSNIRQEKGMPIPRGSNIAHFGTRAEESPRLFVAMPFSDDFIDEFEIGFHEAAKANSFVCERLDLHAFTGDIVTEMKKRIVESHGVIALLNGHNPNVFLEVGFALAYGKPIILIAKEGVELPFDVRSHRCIRYKNILQLRELLRKEIGILKERGYLTLAAN